MKVIYIHQHFMTNDGAGGTRSYDVAKNMVCAGHQVNILTGIYDISGLKPLPWYKFFKTEIIDDIEITVCNVSYSNKFGTLKRYWSFIWFAVVATIAALKIKKTDLVFATSTPLTVGIPGYIIARLKHVPFVFEVRDIWPESFVLSGWAKETDISIRLMAKLESFCYRKATKILLVSKGFEKRLIERGLPHEKLKTILLGADGEMFRNVIPDNGFLDKYNLHNKTIAIYTGAHGKANGLDYVINAAEHSQDRKEIIYVLIGAGSEKDKLKEMATAKGLNNVVFADAVPKEKLPGILSVCHIGLMILKYIEGGRPVTPNKIFDYMFAGIPSIVNFEGPTIDMVKADNSGVYVDGRKPEEMAERVKMLTDNPEMRIQMGQAGKKAAWEKYDRKSVAHQLIETFEQVIAADKKS